MRAVTIVGDHLVVAERHVDEPVADQLVVEVAGAGINRGDLLQVAGRYPPPPGVPADIPGLEFAGTVRTTGPLVRSLRPGDKVFGIVGGGAQAELVLTTEDQCVRVPSGLDLVEAGGVPEVFMTAHDAMVTLASLKAGERVLVHAVGSGVGTAVVQIAVALGCEVVGTARTASKLARAQDLGMTKGILVGAKPDPQAIAAAAGPCQVVIDLVGGDYLEADLMAVDTKGRIVVVGILAGSVTQFNIFAMMLKRATVIGTVLRSRPRHEKAAATAAFAAQMVPLFGRGVLQPVTERTFPLEEAQAAYDLVASDTTFGKVVLVPDRKGPEKRA
jgi:NADPH:quinone reductase-like Zn-dependent oxidoreductase